MVAFLGAFERHPDGWTKSSVTAVAFIAGLAIAVSSSLAHRVDAELAAFGHGVS